MICVSAQHPLELLLRATQDGDEQAFAQLIRHTQPIAAKVIASLGQSQHREDLIQDTYLKVWNQRNTYRGDASINAWIAGIARNTTIDFIRKSVRTKNLLNALESSYRDSSVQPDLSPEYEDLLAVTSAENSEAFLLTQFVGLSYEEASHVLQCPIGTVRSRIARARSALLEAYRAAQSC